jgi:glycolate oxidase FAD binding subunit
VNEPQNIDELKSLLASEQRVLAVGNRSKLPLSQCADVTLVSLRSYAGITEYEPSEFTFTARAGTLVSEIVTVLAEKRQYLPFDPMLVAAGATLGGTVAAGLAGPGRFRYGGLRDFLLGVQFVAGDGALINSGGKVVKNAAGFDIPKYLVGSLGRLGAMTEMTFKVFPQPPASLTLQIQCDSDQQAIERISAIAAARWEADAIDYRPAQKQIALRLRGPQTSIMTLAAEIRSRWGRDVSDMSSPDSYWASIGELNWYSPATHAIKIACTPEQCAAITAWCGTNYHVHWSVAGNILWVLADHEEQVLAFDRELAARNLPGLVVRGSSRSACIGSWPQRKINEALKIAMDPVAKFPSFETKVG